MNRIIDATLRFVDRFSGPMGRTLRSINQSARQMQRLGREIQRAGKKITKTGTSLTKGITAPVVGLGVASLKSQIDFEDAFAGVQKTVKASTAEFDALKRGIRDMSKEIPQTVEELSGIGEIAGQLDIKKGSILKFTKTIADLGVSTNLTNETGASSLAKYANITKMSQKNFDRLGATIVELGNNFATTEMDIVEMAMRLAGAGHQIKLNEAEIMGLAASLSSVGIEAEMGGSAFSKAMIRMKVASATGLTKVQEISKKTSMSLRELQLMSQNDTMGFKDLAQSLGLTKTELNNIVKSGVELKQFAKISGMTAGEFKKIFDANPGKALDTFITGLGNTKKAGKSTIEMLQELGFNEVRLRDSMLRLSKSKDGIERGMNMGNKAWKENNALQEEAKKRYATTASQLKILKNHLNDVGIQIGEILLPSLKEAMKQMEKAVHWFGSLEKGTQKNIVKFALLAATLGPALMIFGKLTSGVGSTIVMFAGLTKAVARAGTRLPAAFALLRNINLRPRGLGGLRDGLNQIGTAARNALPNMNRLRSAAGNLASRSPTAQRIGRTVGGTVRTGAGRIVGAGRAVSGGVRSGVRTARTVAGNTIGRVAAGPVGSAVKGGAGAVGKVAKASAKITGIIGKGLLGPFAKIGGVVGTAGKALFTFLGPVGSVVAILGLLIGTGILVYKNFDKIKGGAKKLGKTIQSIFAKSGIDTKKLGKQFAGLKNTVGQAIGNIKIIIQKILPPLKKILAFVGGVLVTGLAAHFGAIIGFASGLLSGITGIVGGIITVFKGITEFIAGVFTGDWKKCWQGIQDIFGGTFKALVSLAKTPINAVIGLINGAIAGVNKIGIKFPEWVPGLGGKDFHISIPKIPMLYKGTNYWHGGTAMVHDRGAEILDLPKGTRVYPHDESLAMARQQGRKEAAGSTVVIKKITLADTIVIEKEADAKKTIDLLAKELERVINNTGGGFIGDLA